MFNGEVHQLEQVETDGGMRYQSGIGPLRVASGIRARSQSCKRAPPPIRTASASDKSRALNRL
jgi:hypothetical protein